MEEEILLYKGGLKTVELLICEAADKLGHQDDFQNNKWWRDYNFKSSTYSSTPTKIEKCRFKTAQKKKKSSKGLFAGGTADHI